MKEEECKHKREYNEIPHEKFSNQVNIDNMISSEISTLRNSIEMMAKLDRLEQYEAPNL